MSATEMRSLGQELEKESLLHHEEAEQMLREMTVEEKVALLSGNNMWEAGGVKRLKLPPLRFSDGPHGARGNGLHGSNGAALAPCLSALAATFNEEVITAVGEILGQECVARGANVLLGPTVNIHRSPITGRHFECFSEDPHLTSRAAVAFVRGVQKYSAACVKHLVGNDQEADRGHSNSVIPQRVLHEVYLAPFEAAVREADVQAVMPGYNRLNGTYCAENHKLLQETLRNNWGFTGLVVSDWWANRTTLEALSAGLNVEMPGIEPRYYGGYLLEKAHRGEVTSTLLDERCRPVLRTLLRYPRPDRHRDVNHAPPVAERKAVFKRAALESLVLLKNEDSALPLAVASLKRVALLGPQAAETTLQGGGSSRVHPNRSPTILEALQTALSGTGVELVHESGCLLGERPTKNPELEGLKRMGACDASGQPVARHYEAKFLDGVLQVASCFSQKEFFRRRVMPCLRPLGLRHTNPEEAGTSLVAMEFSNPAGEGGVPSRKAHLLRGLGLGCLGGSGCALTAVLCGAAAPVWATMVCAGAALGVLGAEGQLQQAAEAKAREAKSMNRAEQLVSECDAAVMVLGTDGFWECEGVDQPHMRLPGLQDELARRCAVRAKAEGKPLVVVLNVGSPKEIPWLADVPAVLLSYYGGECTGEAVAAALLGASPSGRLPTSWPKCLEEASSEAAKHSAEKAILAAGGTIRHGDVVYHEGLHLGYRSQMEFAFPFGFGLTYTRFEYSDLQVELATLSSATATLEVQNVGTSAAAEVVQVYVTAPKAPRALRAFARTAVLEPQQKVKVHLHLPWRSLGGYYDEAQGAWVAPPAGEVLLEVCSSSKDVRLSEKLLL